jgi:Predicted esterase of the alpha-beta hydrolase superfamily
MNQPTSNSRKKIGLALGSGALKGIAHIGVIKVLEKNHIPIDFIAGSSIGALVGALYAANPDSKALEKIVLATDLKRSLGLLDPGFKKGLLRGKKIEQFLKQYLSHKDFKDLKIPLVIAATNLKTGEAEIIKEGDVISAVRASISLPVVFEPIQREGQWLVDGGMTMPLPVKPLKDMGADIVLAVNLYNYSKRSRRFSKIKISKIGSESAEIMLYQLAKRDIKEAQVVIAPDVEGYNLLELIKHRRKILRLGEEAAEEKIPLIKKLLAKN